MEEQQNAQDRDYSSISPSAKALLLLKGLTNIPFAREAAEIISRPAAYTPDFSIRDMMYWARVMHFEIRYNSIDQLLSGLPVKNILELSSGFSFRGLQATREEDVYYIDTDLPELIEIKRDIIAALPNKSSTPKGRLEVLPLNALDEMQFNEVTSRFPPGEIAIVNEGLLMYLDIDEKKKLCKIIRGALLQRGGCWITADIYLKPKMEPPATEKNDELRQFLEAHNVREKMFESFEEAEAFFRDEGFVIDKEAEQDYSTSGALKYLMESANEEQRSAMGKAGRIHNTWRLKLQGQV